MIKYTALEIGEDGFFASIQMFTLYGYHKIGDIINWEGKRYRVLRIEDQRFNK